MNLILGSSSQQFAVQSDGTTWSDKDPDVVNDDGLPPVSVCRFLTTCGQKARHVMMQETKTTNQQRGSNG